MLGRETTTPTYTVLEKTKRANLGIESGRRALKFEENINEYRREKMYNDMNIKPN